MKATIVKPVTASSAPNTMSNDDKTVSENGLDKKDNDSGSYRIEELHNSLISETQVFRNFFPTHFSRF